MIINLIIMLPCNFVYTPLTRSLPVAAATWEQDIWIHSTHNFKVPNESQTESYPVMQERAFLNTTLY